MRRKTERTRCVDYQTAFKGGVPHRTRDVASTDPRPTVGPCLESDETSGGQRGPKAFALAAAPIRSRLPEIRRAVITSTTALAIAAASGLPLNVPP